MLSRARALSRALGRSNPGLESTQRAPSFLSLTCNLVPCNTFPHGRAAGRLQAAPALDNQPSCSSGAAACTQRPCSRRRAKRSGCAARTRGCARAPLTLFSNSSDRSRPCGCFRMRRCRPHTTRLGRVTHTSNPTSPARARCLPACRPFSQRGPWPGCTGSGPFHERPRWGYGAPPPRLLPKGVPFRVCSFAPRQTA